MQADIPLLRKIGGLLAAVGPKIGEAHTKRSGDLVPTGDTTGWSSAAAVARSASAWQSFLPKLATDVTGYGDGLVAAADAMRQADQDAATRTSAAGGVR